MVSCAAFGCKNQSKDPDFGFHKVLSLEKGLLRKKWLQDIRRERKIPKDSGFYICSKQFEEHYFQRDLLYSIFRKVKFVFRCEIRFSFYVIFVR